MDNPNDQRIGKVKSLIPGQTLKWPQGASLEAIEEITIAMPKELFGKSESIGSVVETDDEAELMVYEKEPNLVYVRLKPGMFMTVHKSTHFIVARSKPSDQRPRKAKLFG